MTVISRDTRIKLLGQGRYQDSMIVEMPVFLVECFQKKEKSLRSLKKKREKRSEESEQSKGYSSVESFMKDLF